MSNQWKELVQQGFMSVKIRQEKTIDAIDGEFAELVNVGVSTVKTWRTRGKMPDEGYRDKVVEEMVRYCHTFGRVDRTWAANLLACIRHPNKEGILRTLFGEVNSQSQEIQHEPLEEAIKSPVSDVPQAYEKNPDGQIPAVIGAKFDGWGSIFERIVGYFPFNWRYRSPLPLLVFFLPFLVASACPLTQIPTLNSITLADFEHGNIGGWYAAHPDSDGWKQNEVASNVFASTDAAVGTGALECDFDFSRTADLFPRATCFWANLPIRDWSDYTALQFQAKSLVSLSTNTRVFIALTTGEDSCWNELGDFQRLRAEYQTFTFQLDRALYKTCENSDEYKQNLIGKASIRRLHLIFTSEHQPSGAVLVDEIRLLKSQ